MLVVLLLYNILHTLACDSTMASREAVRLHATQALQLKGYVAHPGVYECIEESGASGAGNPESNTCYIKLNISNTTLPPNIFQLDETDVLLYLGCAPEAPGPLYYGWSPYLVGFTFLDALQKRPGGQMCDSLNHLSMNSSQSVISNAALPWGATQGIVIGADANSVSDVKHALALLFPAAAVNTISVPSNELQVMSHKIANPPRPRPARPAPPLPSHSQPPPLPYAIHLPYLIHFFYVIHFPYDIPSIAW
jgi:hypothetical protein